ncbi:MAG: hypothetical protein ABI543_02565 [Ignavibacteria bacterium]
MKSEITPEIKHTKPADKFYTKFAVILAALGGFISQYYSYIYNYNYAYRDAIYRMEAARRFFDSITPGIYNQLGTVWLPIPNLILMPLASIDYLWQTGLAASIINLPAFVISCLVIFLIIKQITQDPAATWFGFLIFVFNYNILYFQTTAMTEQLYLTFMICSLYYLMLWSYENKRNFLLYSSIFVSLGIGTRYDAWPVAIVSILLVLIICIVNKDKPVKHFLLIGTLPILFIALWFLYNWLRYGDALEFSRGQYSTLHQLKYYEERGRLLTKNNLWLSAKVYFSSILLYSGLINTIIGFAGLIVYSIKEKFKLRSLLLYILWIALPTTLILLYKGQLIIELPNSEPPGYFNSRYGLYIFPAIAIFSGLAASYLLNLKFKKTILLLLALVFVYQQYLFFDDFPVNLPAIAEVKASSNQISENLSFYLKNNYKGGKILYDNIIFALHPWTGINLVDRITFNSFIVGAEAMKTPSQYVEWVLVYKEANNDQVYDAVKDNPDFLNNFELKFSEYGVEAYEKKH